MAAWIVREEIEHLDLAAYQTAANHVLAALRRDVEHLYLTDCPHYGDANVPVKYFLWVKVVDCGSLQKGSGPFSRLSGRPRIPATP